VKHHALAEGGSREAVKALNSRARGPRRLDHRLRTKPGYLSAGMRVVQDRGAMSGGDVVSIRRWRAYSTSEVGGEVPGDGAVSEPRELRSRLSATRGRGGAPALWWFRYGAGAPTQPAADGGVGASCDRAACCGPVPSVDLDLQPSHPRTSVERERTPRNRNALDNMAFDTPGCARY